MLLISFPKAFVWIGWKKQIEINLKKKKIESKNQGRAKNNIDRSSYTQSSLSVLPVHSQCVYSITIKGL